MPEMISAHVEMTHTDYGAKLTREREPADKEDEVIRLTKSEIRTLAEELDI